MVYTVNVMQKHIDAGVVGHCKKCPIALAIQETVGNNCLSVSVIISSKTANLIAECVMADKLACTYALPNDAFDFIRMFDSKLKAEPFTFCFTDTPLP